MPTITFKSEFSICAVPMPTFTDDEIKNEPMFFSSDAHFPRGIWGPITREFLARIHPDIITRPDFIFDSRSHMLMPGMFPCIPGWHVDDVPRTRPDGQPDHANPEYRSEHIMCLIGDCSVTSFLSGTIELEDVPIGGGTVYKAWDEEINKRLITYPEAEVSCPVGVPVHFNCQSFHRGNPATKNGWRWFGRVSWNTNRKPKNEIRKQVQVYMPVVNQGW
jgi:hypothetical protein